MANNDGLGMDDLNLNTEVDVEDESGPTRNLRDRNKKKNMNYIDDQGLSRRERRKVTKKNYATGEEAKAD